MIGRVAAASIALGLAAACTPAAPPVEGHTSAPELRAVAMPGPAAQRGEAAVALNAKCEGCHRDVADEWRKSLHQRAHVEPAYQRSFAIEPLAFCRGCHAPEGDPASEPTASVGALGVGCVTCHVVGDDVLGAPRADADSLRIPHEVVRDVRFASADACGSCHEFAFPGAAGRNHAELMQSTISEHRDSEARGESCASCHMPVGSSGKKSHEFRASRDEALLKKALRVEVERVSATTVRFVLTPVGVGHAFPTGDLFRRLELSAEAFGPDNLVVSGARRYLTRHFEIRRDGGGKRLVKDDRLRDGATTIDVELDPAAEGFPVAWRVGYQRVAHPEGVSHEGAVLEADIELARGEVR
ncbi:MAG: hypothetical protein HOV80_05010 [Polyangiaceae bacterium]|nr:hypothetical protein [Polyangiaceae bacterium]